MDKDIVVYFILFALISIGAYKNNIDNKRVDNRLEALENTCILLTVKTKKMESEIHAIKYSIDSTQNVYLHK
jgi:peptidoglycan hydrolase CwlO-like protein